MVLFVFLDPRENAAWDTKVAGWKADERKHEKANVAHKKRMAAIDAKAAKSEAAHKKWMKDFEAKGKPRVKSKGKRSIARGAA